MRVQVNGEQIELPDGSTVRDLIDHFKLTGPVAVELNQAIVSRSRHAELTLSEGDTLEIVTLVGGG